MKKLKFKLNYLNSVHHKISKMRLKAASPEKFAREEIF